MSGISSASSMAPAAMNAASVNANMSKLGQAAEKLTAAAKDKNMEKINATAQDFEAVFITEMMKPMFETVEVDEQFGGGKGEEVFRDFMTNEYGKQLAKKGGFGIADGVRAQLIHLQEVASGKTAVTAS